MPLTKIQFTPGIVKETTNYTQSGGWFDCDKMRFRQGCPEKIGGWLQILKTPFAGTCRYIHQWSSYETNQQYLGMGTSSHLYILWSENYYDLTPIRGTATLTTDPLYTAGDGSNLVYVYAPNNGLHVGDYVTLSGVTTPVDIYTPAMLNQQFEVTGFDTNPDNFQITMPVPVPKGNPPVHGGGGPITVTYPIASGLDDAVIGEGWGVPPWGGWGPTLGVPLPPWPATAQAPPATGWGVPFNPATLNPVDPSVNQLRLWTIDNFGEDMVSCIRGGPVYYWHAGLGLASPALPLTTSVNVNGVDFVPDGLPSPPNDFTAVQVMVSPNDRHLIAFGCQDFGQTVADPLLVRWSDEENAYSWTPLRTNSAGSQRLSAGSYIICALRTTGGQILIWTDLGIWLQQYIGMPYVFGFQPVAQNLSIVGPNAMVNAGSIVAWMDRGIFYAYTGTVQELPCACKDYVFSNFNFIQAYKVYAGHNHAFGEVIWFYPSAQSQENDSYVIYNYAEQVWSVGQLQRTSWLDMGRGTYPVATDRDNHLIYYHEYGNDANGMALPAWIDSADIDADGGDRYLYVQRFIPDVAFRGAAGNQQAVGVTIFGRPEPLKPKVALVELEVTPYTGQQFVRLRERQISFRIQSDALGVGWRLGTIRTDWQVDGRR